MKELKLVPGRRYKMVNGLKAIIDGRRGDKYHGRAERATGVWEQSLWLDLGENCYRCTYDIVEEWQS